MIRIGTIICQKIRLQHLFIKSTHFAELYARRKSSLRCYTHTKKWSSKAKHYVRLYFDNVRKGRCPVVVSQIPQGGDCHSPRASKFSRSWLPQKPGHCNAIGKTTLTVHKELLRSDVWSACRPKDATRISIVSIISSRITAVCLHLGQCIGESRQIDGGQATLSLAQKHPWPKTISRAVYHHLSLTWLPRLKSDHEPGFWPGVLGSVVPVMGKWHCRNTVNGFT